MTLNVIEQNIPFLLPNSMCKRLGMILNYPDQYAHWTKIGVKSQIHELASDHVAIDIMEYPVGGWKNPHSAIYVTYNANVTRPDSNVRQEEFEFYPVDTFGLKPVCDTTLSSISSDARPEGTTITQSKPGCIVKYITKQHKS